MTIINSYRNSDPDIHGFVYLESYYNEGLPDASVADSSVYTAGEHTYTNQPGTSNSIQPTDDEWSSMSGLGSSRLPENNMIVQLQMSRTSGISVGYGVRVPTDQVDYDDIGYTSTEDASNPSSQRDDSSVDDVYMTAIKEASGLQALGIRSSAISLDGEEVESYDDEGRYPDSYHQSITLNEARIFKQESTAVVAISHQVWTEQKRVNLRIGGPDKESKSGKAVPRKKIALLAILVSACTVALIIFLVVVLGNEGNNGKTSIDLKGVVAASPPSVHPIIDVIMPSISPVGSKVEISSPSNRPVIQGTRTPPQTELGTSSPSEEVASFPSSVNLSSPYSLHPSFVKHKTPTLLVSTPTQAERHSASPSGSPIGVPFTTTPSASNPARRVIPTDKPYLSPSSIPSVAIGTEIVVVPSVSPSSESPSVLPSTYPMQPSIHPSLSLRNGQSAQTVSPSQQPSKSTIPITITSSFPSLEAAKNTLRPTTIPIVSTQNPALDPMTLRPTVSSLELVVSTVRPTSSPTQVRHPTILSTTKPTQSSSTSKPSIPKRTESPTKIVQTSIPVSRTGIPMFMSLSPSPLPMITLSSIPTGVPTRTSTTLPTLLASTSTSSANPTGRPTVRLSNRLTVLPTGITSSTSPAPPTLLASTSPTGRPTVTLSQTVTAIPTGIPSNSPLAQPTVIPSSNRPTAHRTGRPTSIPSKVPVLSEPSAKPTTTPSNRPTAIPTGSPTRNPSLQPTVLPSTIRPTANPTDEPTHIPSEVPTLKPSEFPTTLPTSLPSSLPTRCSPELKDKKGKFSINSYIPSIQVDCEWLQRQLAFRYTLCQPGEPGYINCGATCNNCEKKIKKS